MNRKLKLIALAASITGFGLSNPAPAQLKQAQFTPPAAKPFNFNPHGSTEAAEHVAGSIVQSASRRNRPPEQGVSNQPTVGKTSAPTISAHSNKIPSGGNVRLVAYNAPQDTDQNSGGALPPPTEIELDNVPSVLGGAVTTEPAPTAGSGTGSSTRSARPGTYRPPQPMPVQPTQAGSGIRTDVPPVAGSGIRTDVPPVAGSGVRGEAVGSAVGGQFVSPVTDGFIAGPAVEQPSFPIGNATGAYSDGPIIEDFGTFGSVSAARRYLHVEGLYFTRGDGEIVNSNFGALNNFDFVEGIRVTYGRKSDSIFGREISVTAVPRIDQEIVGSSPIGGLDTLFVPSGGFGPLETSGLFGATDQTQRKESDYYSVEANRVNWGWDLVKTFVGFRYIRFDDSYSITSTNGFSGDTAFFSQDAANSLVGAHIGGELFYDIGFRWSTSLETKYGVFVNINDFDTNLTNNGFTALNSESTGASISTAAELNFFAHYQIRTNLRFKVGYNLLFVGNVSSVDDNLTTDLSPLVGVNSADDDDIFLHGASFGIEIYR